LNFWTEIGHAEKNFAALADKMKFEFGKNADAAMVAFTVMFFPRPFLVIPMIVAALLSEAEATEPKCGMWVYKTESVVNSLEAQKELFGFCQKRQITDLFWQVHFDKTSGVASRLKAGPADSLFLKAAHAQNVRIHALTGDPSHTLSQKHDRVLACVDALIQFNQSSEPEARFDGLHLDIEPHGLPEWKEADMVAKAAILTQFVEVHAKVSGRLKAANAGLIFGTDIVFWLDKVLPDGSPVYAVSYQGVSRDPVQHLLGMVDHVAIMSYRCTVEGRNGTIALVERTIAHADQTRAEVFVGVKMAKIGPPMESYFGRSEPEMQQDLQGIESAYRPHVSYAGLAYFMYEAFKVMPQRATDR
jgi:hypothetical protein